MNAARRLSQIRHRVPGESSPRDAPGKAIGIFPREHRRSRETMPNGIMGLYIRMYVHVYVYISSGSFFLPDSPANGCRALVIFAKQTLRYRRSDAMYPRDASRGPDPTSTSVPCVFRMVFLDFCYSPRIPPSRCAIKIFIGFRRVLSKEHAEIRVKIPENPRINGKDRPISGRIVSEDVSATRELSTLRPPPYRLTRKASSAVAVLLPAAAISGKYSYVIAIVPFRRFTPSFSPIRRNNYRRCLNYTVEPRSIAARDGGQGRRRRRDSAFSARVRARAPTSHGAEEFASS